MNLNLKYQYSILTIHSKSKTNEKADNVYCDINRNDFH